jgi:hypothetical protein
MNTIKITAILMFSLIITVSASPVDIMIGSRGFGMGGAYVALANDPSAAYWNPAGLSQVDEISFMESNWIFQDVEGININYFTVAIPIKYIGTVSGSWLLSHATLEEGWNFTTNKPQSSESANEHTFSLSLGRQLWDKLLIFEKTSLGFSINRHTFNTGNTDDDNGAGLGFDLGLLTYFPYGFSVGMNIRSLGTDVMGYKIDPEVRLGMGYSILIRDMHRITAGIDGSFKKNRDYSNENSLEPARTNQKAYGGLEYAILFNDFEIALRGGGNTIRYNSINTHGFALGFGFKYRSYSLQYAFRGDTNRDVSLGYGHRLSLIVGLGDLIKMPGTTSDNRPIKEKQAGESRTKRQYRGSRKSRTADKQEIEEDTKENTESEKAVDSEDKSSSEEQIYDFEF